MKKGEVLPSQFTTDKGHISTASVMFFGLTLLVIYYQLSFYKKWMSSMDKTDKTKERLDEIERKINTTHN